MDLVLANQSTEWTTSLIQLGGVGACLAWFMFRSEPRLRAIEAAIDRMSRAILLIVGSVPSASDVQKQQAKDLTAEIEKAEKRRGPEPNDV